VEPPAGWADLAGWIRDNHDSLEQRLRRHGGLLFRGFGIDSPPAFQAVASAICPALIADNGEHTRDRIREGIYTPVPYAAANQLLWHNENSFNASWPKYILFCAARPADRGGDATLADSREVYNRIDPRVREAFERHGVMYVRSYGTGLGLDWQEVFRTQDRSEVEARCRANGMSFRWKPDNTLQTSCVRPAVVRHPDTGEPCWFNQAQHWHTACLDEKTRESLFAMFRPEDLPRSCHYGDGSPIDPEVMKHILKVYETVQVIFPWRKGDVLWLDNILAAHGRTPYVGQRTLLVAMGQPTSYEDVCVK
jgi:alpha-ketoglutarate-dependent taurine dioxygenase